MLFRSAEKYGTPLETAKAFGQGALRGGTMGLSDVMGAAGLLGENYVQEAKARIRQNPVASMLSTGLGAGAIMGLTGGITAPAETGVLGAVAAAAAEGGLLNLQNTVTDAALGDAQLTGEKILADLGMGAIIGAPFGAVGYGAKKMFSRFNKVPGSVADTIDRKSTRLNSSHIPLSRMPSSA